MTDQLNNVEKCFPTYLPGFVKGQKIPASQPPIMTHLSLGMLYTTPVDAWHHAW